MSEEMSESLELGQRSIPLDKEGYLVNLEDWDPEVAEALAQREGLRLSGEHWEVVHIIRDFHAKRGLSPVMRIMVRLMEKECGPDKGNSLYLLRLFPDSPAKLAAKIAGLPRPSNCL